MTCLYRCPMQHLLSQDSQHLELLWECGRYVTIQVRLCAGQKEQCIARNLQSEVIKALGHTSLSDSFLTFASMVKTLQISKVEQGADLHLAYNGTVYCAAIHKAALLLGGVLDGSDKAVESALCALELTYGRDILTSEYSKISKLIAYAKGMSCAWTKIRGPTSLSHFVAWLVRLLMLAFKTKLRAPAKASEQWLDKDRKTGQPGFWSAAAVVLHAPGLFQGKSKACKFSKQGHVNSAVLRFKALVWCAFDC